MVKGILLLLFFNFAIAGSSKYISLISSYTSTWNGAVNSCASECKGTPAIIDRETEIAINNIPVTTNGKFWTGLHTVISGWIEIRGCFSLSDVETDVEYEKEFSTIERNSIDTASRKMASACQIYCENANSFALNMYKCLCLRRLPDYSGAHSIDNCRGNCSSDVEGLCGGENFATVYTHAQGIATDVSGNCVGAYCDSDLETSFNPYSCKNKDSYYICVTGPSLSDVEVIKEDMSWIEGLADCKTLHSNYLVSNSEDFCKSIDRADENYWIGVFRHRGFRWRKVTGSRKLNCVSLNKSGSTFKEQCMESLPFLCEFENISSVTQRCISGWHIKVTTGSSTTTPYTTESIQSITSSKQTNVTLFTEIDVSTSSIHDGYSEKTTLKVEPSKDNTITMDNLPYSTAGYSSKRSNDAPESTQLGVIIGSVLSVCVVAALIAIVVFCKRRNKKLRSGKKQQSDKERHFDNVTYNRNPDTANLTNINAKAEQSNHPNTDKLDTSEFAYEFAHPVKHDESARDTEETYYECNNESDYDHLGIKRSRKLKTDENTLYDHAGGHGDMFDMYDTTKMNVTVSHTDTGNYADLTTDDPYDLCQS